MIMDGIPRIVQRFDCLERIAIIIERSDAYTRHRPASNNGDSAAAIRAQPDHGMDMMIIMISNLHFFVQ